MARGGQPDYWDLSSNISRRPLTSVNAQVNLCVGKIARFYQAEDGKTPAKEFLDSLPGKVAQKVLWVLMVAEELDILPTTYFKKLVGSDDIWECRVQFGSNDYRILCFHAGGSGRCSRMGL